MSPSILYWKVARIRIHYTRRICNSIVPFALLWRPLKVYCKAVSQCRLSKESGKTLAKILSSKLNIALIILIVITVGCGPTNEKDHPIATPNADGIIEVSMRNYEYEPRRMAIDSGSNVSFRLTSTDTLHSFTVNELGINWMVERNQDPQVQVVSFETPGTYQIICVIPGHKQSGMRGIIQVR
jgi:plastocyanin